MATLFYPPTTNGLQKTLSVQLDTAHTAAMTLNNVTGVQNKAGVVVINRINASGDELSAAVREFVSYTGTSGNTLTGLTRALGGSTDQDHAVGSVVEFVPDVTVFQAFCDALDGTDAGGISPASVTTGAVAGDTLALTGDSGTINYSADSDGGDFNIYHAETGAKTLALYGSGASTMNVNLLDGSLTAAGGVIWDGWSPAEETWTYASASTFTIAGVDRTARYTKGTKLYFTQTTGKYAVVMGSSFDGGNTTVTILVNTDYTIANEAITAPYYSYIESPVGYPQWFNYAPSYGASGSMTYSSVTTHIAKVRVVGGTATVAISATGTTGGTASTAVTVSIPFTAASQNYGAGVGLIPGSGITEGGVAYLSSTTVLSIRRANASNWNLNTNASVNFHILIDF